MLLPLLGAAPLVPGRATDNSNRNAQGGRKGAAQHQKQLAPAPPPENIAEQPSSKGTSAANPTRPNAEQTVRVRELPSVSLSRDWADWTLWAASALLALVGVIGIGLAYWTLKAIRRQGLSLKRQTTHLRNSVRQAKRAANAARDTARAMIAIERAWIIVEEARLVQQGSGWFIRPTIKNSGRSMARVRRISMGEDSIRRNDSLPVAPVYSERREYDFLLLPGQDFPSHEVLMVPVAWEKIQDARTELFRLYIFGSVEYLDLADNRRVTRFVTVFPGEGPQRLLPYLQAPPAYYETT